MIVLIPMGGFGSRFVSAGYTINKPCIPTIDRHTGAEIPMVVAAMQDIPGISSPDTVIICVNRDFHAKDGTEAAILERFPGTIFIHDHVLLDQAFACLLAREYLQGDDELIIAACDNGMDLDAEAFAARKVEADALMISHSGDENIARNPEAHSWAELAQDGRWLQRISLKKRVSEDYMSDHATTGMFWFRHAYQFLEHLEAMIASGDSLQEKHLVDRVLQFCINAGLRVGYFDVRYHCWGTPRDYEAYQETYRYWSTYVDAETCL